jgi:hypothetical protein
MVRRHPLAMLMILSMAGAAVASGAACGDNDGGAGTVAVEVWGEEFIEDGIPAGELEDGWAITYDSFVVTLGAITAAGEDFDPAQAFDLTGPGPLAVASGPAVAGAIEPVSYSLVVADGSTTNVNVDTGLFDTMVTEGWSVYVEGSATKDGSTVTFAWGFDVAVGYVGCHATGTVPDGGTGTVQLTIHGDHLLYESLVDAEAGLRFGAIANADADRDGEVTPAELAAFSGVDFQALDNYDVPGGSAIDNLWDYLTAQIETLGHIDGEGHCDF